ncbi:MAG: GntR family transcriptional regulator [Xanthomonadaceae bacterium]|jgi:GntR family transcriptional regulator|nr:GntR family transcriptional regulator [Xanthomonadaceae bacterium]
MDAAPHYRPLYRQVYDFLVKQIADSVWRPNDTLPSEQALAEQLRVSQGTVRKALDTLVAEKLIERRQGKGTFVAEHTQERALFRFFRLSEPGGERTVPTSSDESVKRRPAKAAELRKLHLDAGEQVVEIVRTRSVSGRPVIYERSVLALRHFPDIDRRQPLPNTLYAMFQQQYGVNIVSAEEELRADLTRAEDARRLPLAVGAPLLHIERVAIALDGSRVEWRVSRCDTSHLVYAVTLS